PAVTGVPTLDPGPLWLSRVLHTLRLSQTRPSGSYDPLAAGRPYGCPQTSPDVPRRTIALPIRKEAHAQESRVRRRDGAVPPPGRPPGCRGAAPAAERTPPPPPQRPQAKKPPPPPFLDKQHSAKGRGPLMPRAPRRCEQTTARYITSSARRRRRRPEKSVSPS